MKSTKFGASSFFLCILLAVIIFAPAHAVNRLKDISLQKAGDSVVVIITTSQPCEYKSFLTGSKPERIVVDLSGVVNSWTTKKFPRLPLKSIEAIRTSQFSVKPELVTRVVLDIGRPVDFRSFDSGNDVVIKLPAASGESDFAAWSAKKSRPVSSTASVKKKAKKAKPSSKKTVSGIKIESYPKRKVIAYKTSSYRDPFEPLIGGPGGQMGTGLPALENLVLVGVLEDTDGNRALLEDAEGNGYIMMARDRVKNGYLVSVTETKAIFQITEYGWTRTVALELEIPAVK